MFEEDTPRQEHLALMQNYEQPYWEPIGQFVIAFGYLEANVDRAVGRLLAVHDRQAEALTAQIKNLSARINLIQQLVNFLTSDPTFRARAKETCKEVRRLNSYRNNLVHGPWGSYTQHDRNEFEPYWSKLRVDGNDFKFKSFEIRVSELTANRTAVVTASADLSNLSGEVIRNHMKRHGYVPWFDKPEPELPKEDQPQD